METKKVKKPKIVKTELEKIIEENEVTKEILSDLSTVTSKQLEYANNSNKMFEEENEAFFYVSLVFQNNKCASEFCHNFKDFLGIEDTGQIFINGHELAAKWGKPIKTSYVTKTVNIEKARDSLPISEVGVYGD